MKVVIVGKASVGKTTLVKRIFNQEIGLGEKAKNFLVGKGERKATDGIEMHEWSPHSDKELSVIRLWDFAGQEMFYTTHQFFLSSKSITFFLFNLTEEIESSKIEYWINSIQYRAPGSKVMIIGTFLDQLNKKTRDGEIKLKSEKIEKLLLNKCNYKKYDINDNSNSNENNNEDEMNDKNKIEIIECKKWKTEENEKINLIPILFWPISGMKGIGIKEIKDELTKLTTTTSVRKEIAQLSKDIISMRTNNEIEKNKESPKSKSYFSYFSSISNNEDVNNEKYKPPLMKIDKLNELIFKFYGKEIQKEVMIQVRNQLHELGFILDYSQWKLNEIIYDPQWLADLFRCIVSLKNENQIKDGMMKKKIIIDNIRKFNTKEEDEKYLIDLLLKFEIFIQHPEEDDTIIIPFLMESNWSKEIEKDWKEYERKILKKLQRNFIFPFLPSGIMSKIIYGFHHPQLKQFDLITRFWKNGILVIWKKGYVLVELIEEEREKKYEIKITSTGENDLLNLENIQFIVLETIEKEYPLLIKEMKKEIIYFHLEEKFKIDWEECERKAKMNRDIKIGNKLVIPAKEIFSIKGEREEKETNYEKEKLIIGECISNKGATGVVNKCRFNNISGVHVIKIFKTKEIKDENKKIEIKQSFEREKEILNQINHPHLVPLLSTRKYQEEDCFIFNFYDKSLKDILIDNKRIIRINEKEKLDLLLQITNALDYLHSKLIVHLDIKVRKKIK